MPTFGCELTFDLVVDTVLALQVAVAEPEDEHLDVSAPVEEIPTPSGAARIHVVRAPAGPLTVRYHGTAPAYVPSAVSPEDEVVFRRQSRYCPSDALEGFATSTFAGDATPYDIATWVFERLTYESGSSDGLDTAVDTLLAGKGVCRDFAHLTVALCRSVGYAARLTAVYAPGLDPMDFHAVAEVAIDGRWQVHDATRLAAPETFVRICSGRDAADTAFASTLIGDAQLRWASVTAST